MKIYELTALSYSMNFILYNSKSIHEHNQLASQFRPSLKSKVTRTIRPQVPFFSIYWTLLHCDLVLILCQNSQQDAWTSFDCQQKQKLFESNNVPTWRRGRIIRALWYEVQIFVPWDFIRNSINVGGLSDSNLNRIWLPRSIGDKKRLSINDAI